MNTSKSITLDGTQEMETEHVLRRRSVEWITNYQPGTIIECEKGALWLTISGDAHDYILLPGQKFSSPKRGRVLIEAVRDAVVHIEHRN